MTCKIIFGKKEDGSIDKSIIQEVKAPNNKRSLLYDSIRDVIKDDISALNQYAITYTDEFKKWAENKPVDENNEVFYNSLNEFVNNKSSASLNSVSDNSEQDVEIKNKFRKANGERPKLTWEKASQLAREFNTNDKKYPDNQLYKAESIKYEDDGKVYYRVRLVSKPINNTIGNILTNTYFKNQNTRKSYDVVNDISKSKSPFSSLAKKLLPYVKQNNIDIKLSKGKFVINTVNNKQLDAAGVYNHNGDIELFVDQTYNAKYIERLILHEVLHSVTYHELRENTKASNEFRKLYNYAKTQIPDWKNKYAMNDIDEFMVAIFTDSKFVTELSNIPPMSGAVKFKNMFEEVMDFLLSLIGINKSNPSLYEQSFSTATNILENFRNRNDFSELPTPAEPLFSGSDGIQYSRFLSPNTETEETINNIIQDLANKFSLPVMIITDPNQRWAGKFEDGRITLNKSYLNAETPWHEFAHPFVEMVKLDNKELYNNLKAEVLNTEYGQSVLQQVKDRYPELSEEDQIEEAIVEVIARFSTGKITNEVLNKPENKGLFTTLVRFLNSIRDSIAKLLRIQYNKNNNIVSNEKTINYNDINIDSLNNKLTLKDMSDIMKYGKRIVLDDYKPLVDTLSGNIIQNKNTFTVSQLGNVYHNIGAYMNNAGVMSITKALDNFIINIKNDKNIELAAYSDRSKSKEFVPGKIKLSFKQETPLIYSFLQDAGSRLELNKRGDLNRVVDKTFVSEYTVRTDENEIHSYQLYDEVFINATKNNIESIVVMDNLSNEEFNKLIELSELVGAPVTDEYGDVIHQPKKKSEYKPSKVKYSKFTDKEISDEVEEVIYKLGKDNEIENGLLVLNELNNIDDNYKYHTLVVVDKSANFRLPPIYLFTNNTSGNQIGFRK